MRNLQFSNFKHLYVAILVLASITLTCEREAFTPLNVIENDSLAIAQLLADANNLSDSHPDSAKVLYEDGIQLIEQWFEETSTENSFYPWLLRHQALLSRGLGVYYTNKGELHKAIDIIDYALSIAEGYEQIAPDDFRKDVVAIMNSKGVVQRKFGLYKEALETYMAAVSIAQENNDLASVAVFYTNTGNIYQEIGEPDKSMEYIEKAISMHKELDNPKGIAASSLTLANILNSQGKFSEARPYYIVALDFCKERGLTGNIGLIESNLGVLERRLGNFQDANTYFSSAVDNLTKAGNRQGLALVYGNLADLAIAQENFPDAITFAAKQLDEAKHAQALVNQRYAYKHLSKAFAGIGDHRKAYENHLSYTEIHDSIMSIEKRNEISRLEAVYQDEKKKEEIEYLASLSAMLENKNRIKNIMLVLISLLTLSTILLAAAWVNNNRLKAKRSQLELEHKLLRSQMNPHFLFNSLSTIQNMIIRADKMEAAGLVASFAKFIRFVLDSSMNNLVPLDKEIEAIRLFLDLQKVRFPNLFTYTIDLDIDEPSSDILIPPLIIQPFAENSVIHGFPKDITNGEIHVRFYTENDMLLCSISDNGVGMGKSTEKKEGTHHSVATQITRERLSILSKRYNCSASISYKNSSEESQGTSVLIKLPKIFHDIDS